MKIYPYQGKLPQIDETAFVADYVVITGEVTVGANSNIWYNTVIRGDVAPVSIGENVNIQENSVLHQSTGIPLVIEDDVTVGHQCVLHSCTIRKKSLIGMGSIILDGAEIGEGSFIGAGSLVSQNKVIPPNSMAYGRPAKVIRELTADEQKWLKTNVENYVKKGKIYKEIQKENK